MNFAWNSEIDEKRRISGIILEKGCSMQRNSRKSGRRSS